MNIPNFDRFWGVELKRMHLDYARMAVMLELCWTNGDSTERAQLIFSGVTALSLEGEKVFASEVVELISIEVDLKGDVLRVVGELSNYSFTIDCVHVDERAA